MKLPTSLTTVTTFSKLLAMVLFITFPFAGFYLGMKYQQQITVTTPVVSEVQKKVIPTPISTLINTANWKTYTRNVPADKTSYYNDPKFTIAIQYPSDWVVKESHTLSNRVVDNPKEINKAVLSGKEGEIIMEWGPMGFGGGCDPSIHKMLKLKDIKVDTCQSKDSNGNQSWSAIDSPNVNQPFEARASASSSDPSGNIIKKIFSTLQFTN